MKAKMRGVDEIIANAEPEKIWVLLEDGTRLQEWKKNPGSMIIRSKVHAEIEKNNR